MSTALRTLVLCFVAALLLLQPAARAGAGCAETMLTGACECTEAAPSGTLDSGSCCGGGDAGAQDESSPDDGSGPALAAESGCQCTASPLPDLPVAPQCTASSSGSLAARVVLAAQCALLRRIEATAAPEHAPPRAPPPGPASIVPRGSTARTLAFLGTCLR